MSFERGFSGELKLGDVGPRTGQVDEQSDYEARRLQSAIELQEMFGLEHPLPEPPTPKEWEAFDARFKDPTDTTVVDNILMAQLVELHSYTKLFCERRAATTRGQSFEDLFQEVVIGYRDGLIRNKGMAESASIRSTASETSSRLRFSVVKSTYQKLNNNEEPIILGLEQLEEDEQTGIAPQEFRVQLERDAAEEDLVDRIWKDSASQRMKVVIEAARKLPYQGCVDPDQQVKEQAQRDRNIDMLSLRYGLHEGDESTLRDIGSMYSLSVERVRTIVVGEAPRYLKAIMVAMQLDPRVINSSTGPVGLKPEYHVWRGVYENRNTMAQGFSTYSVQYRLFGGTPLHLENLLHPAQLATGLGRAWRADEDLAERFRAARAYYARLPRE